MGWSKNMKHTDATKTKMSAAKQDRKLSPAHREAISAGMKQKKAAGAAIISNTEEESKP